jgi:myo-inositol-1(or 4)-monophosphatase
MIRSALLNVMVNAAFKAGRGLKRDFGEVEHLQVSIKGPGDFVSLADKRSEEVLYEELNKARPGYGFIGEEGGKVDGADQSHTWHVDPLDGTTNFLHAVPYFNISIGLEREGQMIAGVVYNPISEEIFYAEKGFGAFMNDRRLRVSARKDPTMSMVICGLPHIGRGDHHQFRNELSLVQARYGSVRSFGAAALDLCYVAAGKADAYWERGLNSWDLAAGVVILREAGGFITDCEGGADPIRKKEILVGNEAIHKDMLAVLKKANKI